MRISLETILIVFSILVVVFILSPLEFAFVVSGSMIPTIQPNSDVFIIDKSADSADQYSEGDVITFYSPTNERLTTHRVINKTADGLITQGDDSFQTDQERGDPPISDDLIRGKGVMFNGGLLIIPNLAEVAILFDNYTREFLFTLLVALLISEVFSSGFRSRKGSYLTPFKIIFVVSLFLLVLWTGVIYMSAVTLSGSNIVITDQTDISSEQFADRGEVINRTQEINIDSTLPSHDEYRILNDNMEIKSIEREPTTSIISFTAGPYEERTVKTPVFRIYTYPLTLPPELISYLHRIHPIVASLGTLSVIALPINILILLLTNNTRIRTNRIRALRDINWFNNRGR